MTTPYDNGRAGSHGAVAYRPAAAGGAVAEPSRGPSAAALLDLLPDAAIVLRNGQIMHANARGLVMLGAPSMESLLARRVEEFLVPMPAGLAAAALPPGAASRQIADSTVLRNDGTMVEVELYVGSTHWDGRRVSFLMLRDITERRMTERALQTHIDELEETLESSTAHFEEIAGELHRAKEAADAASRTKSEFLANMSHELRTPLNAIMGFSEIIKNEMFGPVNVPQYVEYARDIFSSGAHLLDIINDILDLSKVESGKFELLEENVAVEEVIFAVCNLIKGKADEKNLHIAPRLPGIMPRLYADKRALKQMMLNLLSNAVKFTPQDGEVSISAGVDEDGGIAIVVSDSGIGIAAEDMDKVFSPFGQVDSALAREHEGTGLGVPLVKAMVELHGGSLGIASAPGKGSRVTLRFPPRRSVQAAAA